MRGEKFVFVEHVAEHAHQALARGNGEHAFVVVAARFAIGDILRKVGAVFQKPLEAFVKPGQFPDGFLLENFHGDQRQQADDRARFQGNDAPVGAHLVVVKSILLIPQSGAAEMIHRVGDLNEVLKKFRRHVLVGEVDAGVAVLRQFERHAQHRAAVESHPRRAVGLAERAAIGQRLRAIEDADVVEAEESTGEKILAGGILAIDPPREIQQQLLEDALEETAVALSALG